MLQSLPPAAVKQLLAQSPDGELWDMQVCIWPPEAATQAPWGCKVEITRLFTPPRMIYGEDSWQAQALAMSFAASLILSFVEKGGALFWPSGPSNEGLQPFNVADLLPQAPK